MKIVKIEVFNFDLNYIHGVYTMSGGRDITTLQSTLVCVTSDIGLEGWGGGVPIGQQLSPRPCRRGARRA